MYFCDIKEEVDESDGSPETNTDINREVKTEGLATLSMVDATSVQELEIKEEDIEIDPLDYSNALSCNMTVGVIASSKRGENTDPSSVPESGCRSKKRLRANGVQSETEVTDQNIAEEELDYQLPDSTNSGDTFHIGSRKRCYHQECWSMIKSSDPHPGCIGHSDCLKEGTFDPQSCNVCRKWLQELSRTSSREEERASPAHILLRRRWDVVSRYLRNKRIPARWSDEVLGRRLGFRRPRSEAALALTSTRRLVRVPNPEPVNQRSGSFISGRPLADHLCHMIIEMSKTGMHPAEIARHVRVSHGCVSKILLKYQETGIINTFSTGGSMPTAATPDVVNKIADYKQENPKINSQEIRDKLLTEGIVNRVSLPSMSSISSVVQNVMKTCRTPDNSDDKILGLPWNGL